MFVQQIDFRIPGFIWLLQNSYKGEKKKKKVASSEYFTVFPY